MTREEAIRHLGMYVNNDCYTTDHRDACRMAVAALREQEERRWIPLSEQKPNRDDLVIVFFEGMKDTPAAIQILHGWCICGSASHWMPLPEPPKAGS